ncbi:MAG: hydroxymethylbilane synthase [Bacteroidota bacterium]|nr:hydroxymethylbilane synthase [Bacteroidota bacterium]MDP4233954.1 hydroxymethylbilane synthase [Bacteroidota bacterium]MDP4242795.1 hydroxymethylbilane synthase [Bacteroidota bacterium]MDP4288509.1 hydroxymethylbilane synthase [Bacteroidota bacterium]
MIIGSRGSDLALWQANHVRDLLLARYPGLKIDIEIIHTMGDKILDSSLSQIGGKGVFTKEIETALLDRSIDIAVHSLKDLPTAIAEDLTIAAIPERAPVEDAFLAKDPNTRLMDLPDGARIATGSLRRKAQLLSKRPDFQIIDIRGNVPTRIRKMLDSNWDGMILASAGLHRLGLTEHMVHAISVEWVLPAVGQGALGIQCRADDPKTIGLLAALDHAATRYAVTAERALLSEMGGGCQVPIGAFGRVIGDTLELTACVAALTGESVIRGSQSGPVTDAAHIGAELASILLGQGGRQILDEVFRLEARETPVSPHPEA